jgi:hypothetical protein
MSKKINMKYPFNFPIVKNVPSGSVFDNIKPMNPQQVQEAMKKMFEDFETMTGHKVVIKGNRLPTRSLIPKEHKKK